MTAPPFANNDLALRDGASIALFKDRKILVVKRGRIPIRRIVEPARRQGRGERDAAPGGLPRAQGGDRYQAEIEGIVDTVRIAAGNDGNGQAVTCRLTCITAVPAEEPSGPEATRKRPNGSLWTMSTPWP